MPLTKRIDKGGVPQWLVLVIPMWGPSRTAVHWEVDMQGSRGEVCCEVGSAFRNIDAYKSRKTFFRGGLVYKDFHVFEFSSLIYRKAF